MSEIDESQQIAELHAMASRLLSANSSQATSQSIRARMGAIMSGTYDAADTLHNIYLDFGYPFELTFSHFWNMYRRFGIAANVINLPVDICWITAPTIEFSNGQDEAKRLFKRIKFFNRLKGLDKRQRVGRYAGTYMRVRDGQPPDTPLSPDSISNESSVIEMIPLYESQLEVIKVDTDPTSDYYGKPIIVQYSQAALGSRNEEVRNSINIHSSRIIFASEGSDDGTIYQIPILEPIYNSLLDLRKIIGAGGEGFYKNAAQSTIFDLKDPSSASIYKDQLDEFNDKYDDFVKNRMRRGLWTPGMEAKTLESHLVSPEPHFNSALNDVAAGSKIAATILIGKQTGRLASDEDSKQLLSTCQSRRNNWLIELLTNHINWFMEYGVLRQSDFEITWDDLLAIAKEEKLKIAETMSKINTEQFRSGGEVVFDSEEIREQAGYEPMESIPPGSESLDDE